MSLIDGYMPAFGLYRSALLQQRAAIRYKRSPRLDRRSQEQDAVGSAMILTQASLEFWIKHVCQVEGQQTKGETRGRNLAPWACLWLDLPPLLAQRDGRHTSTEVTEKHELALRVLNGLRNYLVHGDLNARTRAEELVGTSGSEVLSHYVSGLMLQAADELFAYGIDHTGHLAPTKKRLLEMQPDLLS